MLRHVGLVNLSAIAGAGFDKVGTANNVVMGGDGVGVTLDLPHEPDSARVYKAFGTMCESLSVVGCSPHRTHVGRVPLDLPRKDNLARVNEALWHKVYAASVLLLYPCTRLSAYPVL